MTPLLPAEPTQEVVDILAKDRELVFTVARALRERHGLSGDPEILGRASTLCCGIGDLVVMKVFAPHDLALRDTEAAVLAHLEGQLPVATPSLLATDEIEGWPYVLMSRLPGRTLGAWRGTLSKEQLARTCGALGELIAALHALPLGPLATTREAFRGWVASQRAAGVAHHRSRGLAEEWLELVPGFLDRVELGLERDDWSPVMLHTEIMEDHVLVEERSGAPCLSGLVDFEPSMGGHPDYELASVGLFVTRGEPGLFAAFLAGYGAAADDELPRRALSWSLLHRYANLARDLRNRPVPPGPPDLDALARLWWRLD